MGSGVQPCKASSQNLDEKITALKISLVYVGDLKFTSWRWLQPGGNAEHVVIVEIKAGHRDVRLRLQRLFFDRQRLSCVVKLDDAKLLGRFDHIAKHGGAASSGICTCEKFRQPVTIKNIVTEDKC